MALSVNPLMPTLAQPVRSNDVQLEMQWSSFGLFCFFGLLMRHIAILVLDVSLIMKRKRNPVLLTTLISSVVAHFRASIRNPESLVDTADEEDSHDQDINGEVKDIEAGLAVIPGWVGDRARWHPRGTGTE